MIRMSRAVHTTVPADAVFDFLADFTTTEQWDPGTVSTVRTAGDGQVGTRYTNVTRFAGRTVETEYTVTALEPDRKIVLAGRNPALHATDTITVDPTTSGSVVGYTVEFAFQGALGRIEFLLWPLVYRLVRAGAARLRTTVEARS